ncbi:MAG: endonuclease [Bacteroidales bacterium]|nr:endonuclease [Bacteroidales bacterium]
MKKLFILVLLSVIIKYAVSQTLDTCIIAFYNVENLFHPSDDSLTRDEDFTPTGLYHWSYAKYYRKIQNVGKVFVAMGEGKPPYIIGLAEIENEQVLKDLCYRSPIKNYHYRYVHYDSPDRRGVDVALLYRDSCVTILRAEKIPIVFPFEPETRNRDLLYVLVQFANKDSLHLLVNHWTSRFGGFAATIPKRNYYADVARQRVDSILTIEPNAKILLMGDFNDYCTDESMEMHLRASRFVDTTQTDTLFNLMYYFLKLNNVGSHKHEDFWGCLDQLIVSNALLFDRGHLHIVGRTPHIYDAPFLLVPDEKYGGVKNYRTYLGPRYIGGFADHLPVYLRIALSP